MGPAAWDWHRGTTHRVGGTVWGLGIEKCLLQGTLCSTQRWNTMKRAMMGHAGREARLVWADAPAEEQWIAWGLLDVQRCQR